MTELEEDMMTPSGNRHVRRLVTTAMLTVSVFVLAVGPAFADICINASKNDKNPAAGAQIVFGADDEILHVTKGLEKRFEKGLVDPDTGEGFRGIVAFDVDGDGSADAHLYQVTPDGQIPPQAQANGPACRGITDLYTYLEECSDLSLGH